jgi:hypothetical protein
MRASTLLFHLTQRLLYKKWRDPNEEARLFICRECNVTEKGAIDESGSIIYERLDAMIPAMNAPSEAIAGTA